MSAHANHFGITYPAIDDLLGRVKDNGESNLGSKFALASYASNRARQIVSYYSSLAGGILDNNVGPLVEYYAQEKPLSIAMREINDGKLILKPITAQDSSATNQKNDAEAEINTESAV